jgi:hypothetical protein
MIVFFEDGRLGNQLFQYYGFRKYFPHQQIIFFGCGDLKKSCDNLAAKFIKISPELIKFHILKLLFFLLVKIRIVGQMTQSTQNKVFKLVISRGIIFNVYIARSIYFQHEDCIKAIVNPPILKKKILSFAERWLKKNGILLHQHRLIFVHIRRKDYLNWPSSEFPSALDLSWYKKAMTQISKKISKPIFIIMGDDLPYIYDNFKSSNTLFISNNSPETDLAIMSMCSNGILSASSFAWWGAFFAKCRKFNKDHSHFMAPKFWAGYRLKKWFPSKFFSEWITYLK